MNKIRYLLTLILFSCNMICGSGTLIHLHGVPCSGKSTLSKHLARQYPKTYLHINRDALCRELRKDAIERELGLRPSSRRELKVMEAEYEDKIGPALRSAWDVAGRLSVADGIRKALKGYYVLLDGNISKKLTRHVRTFDVLLYTPLEIIFSREAARSAGHDFPPRARAVLLRRILSVFKQLYRFGRPHDRQRIAVWNTKKVRSLLNNLNLQLDGKQQERINHARREFIKHFRLNKLPRIAIIPRKKHDLILFGAHALPTKLALTLSKAVSKS